MNDETELYDRLKCYMVPVGQLARYGYPIKDPLHPGRAKLPLSRAGCQLRPEFNSSYYCDRCKTLYEVDRNGVPTSSEDCVYHPGLTYRHLNDRFSCCGRNEYSSGCASNRYHVHRGELELNNYVGFVETQWKPEREPNKHGIFALDCEMCFTTYGFEVVSVTVVNHKYEVLYESLVKPFNKVLDYNTRFSGVKEEHLEKVETKLVDVQRELLRLFSSESIIVGHGLDSDMKCLKIFHKNFVDTAQLFPHRRGLPYKRALKKLLDEYLGVQIQAKIGHDSKEDAGAALQLVMWKLNSARK